MARTKHNPNATVGTFGALSAGGRRRPSTKAVLNNLPNTAPRLPTKYPFTATTRTLDQARSRYIRLWSAAKERLLNAITHNARYEQLLSHANKHFEPIEQYDSHHVSGDRNTALYWRARWNACSKQLKFAENRAQKLRTLYINTLVCDPYCELRKIHRHNFYYSEQNHTVHIRTDDGVWHVDGIFDPANHSTEHPATLEGELR